MTIERLLAVDPSLTCSGWSLFDFRTGELLAVGVFKSLGPTIALAKRLLDLQTRISQLLLEYKLGPRDILVCEGETSMKDPRAAIKVEQVRGIFETLARSTGLIVPGRISPRSVQSELLGLKGRQSSRKLVKTCAAGVVQAMVGKQLQRLGYGITIEALQRNQDIVDSILIGSLALSKVRTALLARSSLEKEFQVNSKRRRTSRSGWGRGEANSFGWSMEEISLLGARSK